MGLLVFDSGLGGLTVLSEIRKVRPDLAVTYLADDAVFPYGRLSEADLVARVLDVVVPLAEQRRPQAVVIACNTASTLVLPSLRARYSIPIVGTVPAIKPAAAATRSGLISVLATPGTVSRDYTQDLIREFATGVAVTLVGSKALAGLAERALRGEGLDREAIAVEIAPCFVLQDGRRTDMIVLACTHYPLLIDTLRDLAPWPVEWIDPAPAIARRVAQVLGERKSEGLGGACAVFTAGGTPDLRAFDL